MILYLVRHAKAVEEGGEIPDGTRWLTKEGRAAFRRGAKRFHQEGMAPDLILTSSLVRAVQTAEILACALGFDGPLRASAELASGLSPSRLPSLLASVPQAQEIVLVGHNPDLSILATELSGENILLKKGEAVALTLEEGPRGMRGRILWRIHEGKGGG